MTAKGFFDQSKMIVKQLSARQEDALLSVNHLSLSLSLSLSHTYTHLVPSLSLSYTHYLGRILSLSLTFSLSVHTVSPIAKLN